MVITTDNVSLFSIEQTKHYRLPVGDKILVVEHGDIILPFDTEEDEANGKHSLIVTIVGPFYPLTEKILAHLFGRNFFKVYRVFNNAMIFIVLVDFVCWHFAFYYFTKYTFFHGNYCSTSVVIH